MMSLIEQEFDAYTIDCDKYICSECVINNYLKKIVKDNLTDNACSYCLKKESSEMKIVLENILQAILNYYGDAQDLNIPWVDGGWAFDEIEFQHIVYEFDPGWCDEIREDIEYHLEQDKYWVPHVNGYWGLSNPKQMMTYSWEKFVKTVKYKTRYFFDSEPIDKTNLGHPDYLPVSLVMSNLANVITKLKLIKEIDIGESFYRVQKSNKKDIFNYKRLSVAPKKFVKSGRMNPDGIPYLYLSTELKTAQKEVLENNKTQHYALKIKNRVPLLILDLSELPEIPSIFDHEKYDNLHELYFLKNFIAEISKPVNKKLGINYVPTQIISEYFNHRFKYNNNRINGICFNSSKSEGKNHALFFSTHERVKEIFKEISISEIYGY